MYIYPKVIKKRMKKLYRYRPLSDFLFKELFYQEIYLASYYELNDPLDMNVNIDFRTTEREAIKYLLYFISACQFDLESYDNIEKIKYQINNYPEYLKQQTNQESLEKKIIEKINQTKNHVTIEIITDIIIAAIKETNSNFYFDATKFKSEIEDFSCKFLRNSYVCCFSETNDNFLMWSHYANKHSGVCMEFTIKDNAFPFELTGYRNRNNNKYQRDVSKWELQHFIYWEHIYKVDYKKEQSYINFYDFIPVFENQNDCDLIGLSKNWTHKYAHNLQNNFLIKLAGWAYEKEWRIISINFGKPLFPENRIKHYPIECLSAIYFGYHTPEEVKERIFKIINSKHHNIKYYSSKLTGNNKIEFEEWLYELE